MHQETDEAEEYISFRQMFLPFLLRGFDRAVSGMGRCPECDWASLSVKPNHLQYCPNCKQYVVVNKINASGANKAH